MQNLGAFRESAELNLKVSLRMGSESVIGVSNSCDLAWIGLKSKHFRLEVSIFRKISCNFTREGRTSMSPRCSEMHTLFQKCRTSQQNLDPFRGIAELNLKVYLGIRTERVIGVSNSCDLAWFGLKSKHFRLEV